MGNLSWGLQIGALGMGLVFGLLALLWGLLALVLKFDPPAAAPTRGPSAAGNPTAPPAPQAPEPALVAAITIAVLSHSALLRGEAAPTMRIHWPGSLMHASRWVAAGRVRQTLRLATDGVAGAGPCDATRSPSTAAHSSSTSRTRRPTASGSSSGGRPST